jgi:formylglycine-generating enzyme required for sulfatase activity
MPYHRISVIPIVLLALISLFTALLTVAGGIVVNQLPASWQSHLWLAWPVFIGSTIALFGLAVWQYIHHKRVEVQPHANLNPDVQRLRETYLKRMASAWRTLPLEALDPSASEPTDRRLTLERVYVSLDTTTPRPKELHLEDKSEYEQPPLSAVEALFHADQGRSVLLGQPGSGKSTLGRYLALMLADALMNPGEASLAERIPGWTGPAQLPLFIPLRQLSASPISNTGVGTAEQVTEFIRHRVEEQEGLKAFGQPLLKELQRQGGVIVFDGLDEVAGEQRPRLKQALVDFAEQHEHCRILVTCRVHSYRQDPDWQLPWSEHTLAEFGKDKIEQFIAAWYHALAVLNPTSPLDYLGKIDTLKSALDPDDPRGLRDLAGIPLLLTVMAIVHTHKELPDSRVGVYRECVDILLMRWQGAREGDVKRPPLLNALLPYKASALKVHQGLREIAYQAHQGGTQDRGSSGGRALVSDVIIGGVMRRWLGAQGLDVFLDYCRHTNGLLLVDQIVASGATEPKIWYVFPHLSFEEYLAALHLMQLPNAGLTEAAKRAGEPSWWEVARFYGEYLCHDEQGGNTYLAKSLLEQLCPEQAPTGDSDWRRVWLAGALLPGWQREVTEEETGSALERQVVNRLVALLQSPTALAEDSSARAAAGRVLANLGDPRPGVGLNAEGVPDLLWAQIPGTASVQASGQFPNFTGLRLGSGAKSDAEASDDENWPADAKPLEIADFKLTACPVTVAQFRPFVDQGYGDDDYWSDAGRQWRKGEEREFPAYWEERAWTLDNHPVVGVSWYEAEAYCKWLNAHLPPGKGVRLPTEAEWEWAARGPEGRRYPWGDEPPAERCNFGETGLNRTSAVGAFPMGVSNWGVVIASDTQSVHDLAGNVWEWTSSEYTEDYSRAHSLESTAGALRVVRGGSWYGAPWYVRSASRRVLPRVSGAPTSAFVSPRTYDPLSFVLLPFGGPGGVAPWSRGKLGDEGHHAAGRTVLP